MINESVASSVLSGVFAEEDLLRDNHQTVIILQGDLPNLNLGDATEQLLSGLKVGEIASQTGNITWHLTGWRRLPSSNYSSF